MTSVPLPKSNFKPHPKGQHSGVIFDVEVRLNESTQWGPKHRVILKIQSDTKMQDDNGNPMLDDEGNERGYVIWDWLTVARKEGSRFRERREAILGRPLSAEEANADSFDPVSEFQGQRISYLVKHRIKGDDLYANVDTLWLEDERNTTSVSDNQKSTAIQECAALEKMAVSGGVIKENQIDKLRLKYGQTEDLDSFTFENASKYKDALQNQIPTQVEEDEDDLPF